MPALTVPAAVPVGQVICTQPAAYSFLGTKAATSITLGNGTTRSMAVWVPEPVTLDRIGCEVTIVGEPGSKVRLGIWTSRADFSLPMDLVLDAGTINGDSATVQEITISQALGPGTYWLSATVQAAPAVQPTVRVVQEPVAVYSSNTGVPISGLGPSTRSDAGALPAAWGTAYGVPHGAMCRVFVRAV